MLNFRFPSQEDINLAEKIENSQIPYQNAIGDPIESLTCKSSDHDRGTIFNLLVNNQALGSRKSSNHALDIDESRRRQEKFKEQLINATKNQKPFEALHNSINEANGNSDEISKEVHEKSRLSSDQEKLSNSLGNNGPDSSVASSVQAALNALQAGQLSLNQVNKIINILFVKILYFTRWSFDLIIQLSINSVISSITCTWSPEPRLFLQIHSRKC